ncbi:MAG TPA: hypothetical protein PLX89_26940 [Verrucomicrobiota bacterium]|nr:hypothetical protein [Verrucomicrobiota bacterium]
MKSRTFLVLAWLACDLAIAQTATLIPWDQIGAKAGAKYRGDGLAMAATDSGARLRCAFQRLEGQATGEELWLTSVVPGQPEDRFRIMASAVGRDAGVTDRARMALPRFGIVTLESERARFTRPQLIEEYSVSPDGVRQDFVVLDRPAHQYTHVLRCARFPLPRSVFHQLVRKFVVHTVHQHARRRWRRYGSGSRRYGSAAALPRGI